MPAVHRLARKRDGSWRSQLRRVKWFGGTFAQRVRHELVQLGIGALLGDDAFPFTVAGLLLEEAREIHDRLRLVFGKTAYDFDEFFRCRCRGQRLTLLHDAGKCLLPTLRGNKPWALRNSSTVQGSLVAMG